MGGGSGGVCLSLEIMQFLLQIVPQQMAHPPPPPDRWANAGPQREGCTPLPPGPADATTGLVPA